jgi:hypothetical protein
VKVTVEQAVVNALSLWLVRCLGSGCGLGHTPHCLAYDIPPLDTFNTKDDLDSGMLTVPIDMKTSSGIERLYYSILFGASVQVKSS